MSSPNYNMRKESLTLSSNLSREINTLKSLRSKTNALLSTPSKSMYLNDARIEQDENCLTKREEKLSSQLCQLQQENTTLKADLLMYREEINLLTELNKNLSNELDRLRKKK